MDFIWNPPIQQDFTKVTVFHRISWNQQDFTKIKWFYRISLNSLDFTANFIADFIMDVIYGFHCRFHYGFQFKFHDQISLLISWQFHYIYQDVTKIINISWNAQHFTGYKLNEQDFIMDFTWNSPIQQDFTKSKIILYDFIKFITDLTADFIADFTIGVIYEFHCKFHYGFLFKFHVKSTRFHYWFHGNFIISTRISPKSTIFHKIHSISQDIT